MTCRVCLKLQRVRVRHEVCPLRPSLWCHFCGEEGHLPDECDESRHVYRPRTLEELIPVDVRERWNITTSTPIQWATKRPTTLEGREREICNTIRIVYADGKQDSAIRAAMRARGVPTVHKMEANIQALREWAVARGQKIMLVPEGWNDDRGEL